MLNKTTADNTPPVAGNIRGRNIFRSINCVRSNHKAKIRPVLRPPTRRWRSREAITRREVARSVGGTRAGKLRSIMLICSSPMSRFIPRLSPLLQQVFRARTATQPAELLATGPPDVYAVIPALAGSGTLLFPAKPPKHRRSLRNSNPPPRAAPGPLDNSDPLPARPTRSARGFLGPRLSDRGCGPDLTASPADHARPIRIPAQSLFPDAA